MKNKTGLSLTMAGTVLALLALVFYLMSGSIMTYVLAMIIAAIVFGILCIVSYVRKADTDIFSFLISAEAILIIGAFAYSLIVEVEVLGYLISGLRQWADIQFWAFFSAAALVSWLLLLIASFTERKKNVE